MFLVVCSCCAVFVPQARLRLFAFPAVSPINTYQPQRSSGAGVRVALPLLPVSAARQCTSIALFFSFGSRTHVRVRSAGRDGLWRKGAEVRGSVKTKKKKNGMECNAEGDLALCVCLQVYISLYSPTAAAVRLLLFCCCAYIPALCAYTAGQEYCCCCCCCNSSVLLSLFDRARRACYVSQAEDMKNRQREKPHETCSSCHHASLTRFVAALQQQQQQSKNVPKVVRVTSYTAAVV